MRIIIRSRNLVLVALVVLFLLMLKFDSDGVLSGPSECQRGFLGMSLVNQSEALDEKQPDAHYKSNSSHNVIFPGDLRKRMLENERRKRILSAGCRSKNFTTKDRVNAWEYVIDEDHHLIWCNVFKAGSTSLIQYLFRLRNKQNAHRKNLSTIADLRKAYGRPKPEELEEASAQSDYVSFLVTRHPMERLVSAYRDKVEEGKGSYRKNLQENIFRKVLETSRIPKRSPTFSEFVTYILIQEAQGHIHNEHWIPISRFCTPCHFPFSVISKMETFNEDVELIMWLANQEIGLMDPMNAHKGGKTNREITQSYVGQLSPVEFDAIQNFYHNDYVLFGYDKSSYFPNHTGIR